MRDRKWDRTSDAIFEVIGIAINDTGCEKVFKILPLHTQNEAETWGYNDTVFGDLVREFALENKEKITELLLK